MIRLFIIPSEKISVFFFELLDLFDSQELPGKGDPKQMKNEDLSERLEKSKESKKERINLENRSNQEEKKVINSMPLDDSRTTEIDLGGGVYHD